MKWTPSKLLLQCMGVFGGFLIRAPLSLPWYFGNLASYMYSYFLYQKGPDAFAIKVEWLLACCFCAMVLGVFSIDFCSKKIRLCYLELACILVSDICIILTYFTVQGSLVLVIISLMITCGFALGMGATIAVKFVVSIVSDRVGLCVSIVTSGVGFGALLNNFIITGYLNPNNLSPDIQKSNMVYFSQLGIIDKMPNVFIILGVTSFVMHTFGYIFQQYPIAYFPSMFESTKKESKDDTNADVHQSNPNAELEDLSIAGADNTSISQSETDQIASPSGQQHRQSGADNTSISQSETDQIVSPSGQQHRQSLSNQDDGNLPETLDFKPKDLLRLKSFYVLWYAMASLSLGQIIVLNFYKLYGELWIHDDIFLASVGSVSTIVTCVSRIANGYLVDMIGVKNALLFTFLINSVFSIFWCIAPMIDKWLYFICCNLLVAIQSNTTVMFPLAAIELYGQKYFASNLGMFLTANILISLASPSLLTYLQVNFGWFGMSLVSSISSIVALIAIMIAVPASRKKPETK